MQAMFANKFMFHLYIHILNKYIIKKKEENAFSKKSSSFSRSHFHKYVQKKCFYPYHTHAHKNINFK